MLMSNALAQHKKSNRIPDTRGTLRFAREGYISGMLLSHKNKRTSAVNVITSEFDEMTVTSHFMTKSLRHVPVMAGLCSMLILSPFAALFVSPSVAYAVPTSVESAYADLHDIEGDITETSEKIENTRTEIESLNAQIGELDAQIDDNQKQLSDMQEQLGEIVSLSYKTDDESIIDVLAGCDTLDEFLLRTYAIDRSAGIKADTIDGINDTLTKLNEQRTDAIAKRDELKQRETELEEQSQRLDTQQDELLKSYPQLQNSVEYGTSLDVETMIARAYSIIGSGYLSSGYVWTGDTSTSAFTCSAVIDYALGLPTNSNSCPSLRQKVAYFTSDRSQLKRGDVIFYDIRHVALYIGDGKVIDSIPNGGVQIRDIDFSGHAIGGGPLL